MKLGVHLIAGMAIVLGLSGPAVAESKSLEDPQQRFSQRPALDLERATFRWSEDKLVFRLKLDELSKRRTQALGRLYVGQDYNLMLVTRFNADGRLVARGFRTDGNNYTPFSRGVRAEWNFERDLIIITVTSHLRGRRGSVAAYTVEKGALHGPLRGDYIVTRLRRG